jgi:hypothetical protein
VGAGSLEAAIELSDAVEQRVFHSAEAHDEAV